VGVWKGHGVSFLATGIQKHINNFYRYGIEIYAVDIFQDDPPYDSSHRKCKHLYQVYTHNLKRLKTDRYIKTIRDTSHNASKQFENGYFDFVFIDADHSYGHIHEDIIDWLPKVRGGGILAGHDYRGSATGVTKAVGELLKDRYSVQQPACWEVRIN
jgi:hypothetical protein